MNDPVHHECLQGERAWFDARLGVPTASGLSKIVMPAKLELSKQAIGYADELLAEWILGEPVDGWDESTGTRYMKSGIATEEQAACWFAFEMGLDVQTCGFFTVGKRSFGASPDRLIGDDGLLEIICPKITTHMEFQRNHDELFKRKGLQVIGQRIATKRTRAWILSYHAKIQPVLLDVPAWEEKQQKVEKAVTAFVRDLDARKQEEDPEKWARKGR